MRIQHLINGRTVGFLVDTGATVVALSQADAERMLLSGYESQFIPVFALPGPDGKATGKHIEGSVKGPGAVDDLVPRLKTLLADAIASSVALSGRVTNTDGSPREIVIARRRYSSISLPSTKPSSSGATSKPILISA